MSCLPPGRKPEPEPEPEPPGFFASLFGFGRSDPAKCKNCGQETCACANSELRAHLKDCCQLGSLPEPYKCPPPKPKTDNAGNSQDSNGPVETRVEGDCSCRPVYKKSNTTANKGDICSQLEQERQAKRRQNEGGDKNKNKCPPFPKTDTKTCIPKFLCKPGPSDHRIYAVPPGEIILPISAGLRMAARKVNKCTECGRDNEPPEIPEPNVSIKNCPAMRVDCRTKSNQRLSGNSSSGNTQTYSFYSGGFQEATDFQKVCKELKVEDEEIRHHRDVFNPTLVIRGDGYMSPIFKVSCAGKYPPNEDKNYPRRQYISERDPCQKAATVCSSLTPAPPVREQCVLPYVPSVPSCPPPVTSCPPPVTSCPPPVTSCPPPVTSCPPPVTSCPPPVASCAGAPALTACPPSVPTCAPGSVPACIVCIPQCVPVCEPPREYVPETNECPAEEVLEDCEEEILETECEEDEEFIEEEQVSCDCGGGEEEFEEEEFVEEEAEVEFEEECGDFQEDVCLQESICPPCPPCPTFQRESSCFQQNSCQPRVIEDPCSKKAPMCEGPPLTRKPSLDNCSYSPKPLSFNDGSSTQAGPCQGISANNLSCSACQGSDPCSNDNSECP